MNDGIIKGVGNSRYLKSVASFLSLYPTYEAFAQALIEGTLPVDFNGINEAGWSQLGTPLNKANLLSDATAGLLDLTSAAVPDEALVALVNKIKTITPESVGASQVEVVSWVGTNSKTKAVTFSFTPKLLVLIKGNQYGDGWDFNDFAMLNYGFGSLTGLLWGKTKIINLYINADDLGTTVSYSEKTVTFSNTQYTLTALNGENVNYAMVAFG